MKTQETVLKQYVISALVVWLVSSSSATSYAYSIRAPWINETGPTSGFILRPEIGWDPSGEDPTNLRAGLGLALDPDLNFSGTYSSQTEQLLDLDLNLGRSASHSITLQAEGTDSQNSELGFTVGLFQELVFSIGDFQNLKSELGLGLHYEPVNELTTLPLSAKLTYSPRSFSFIYGAAFRGEVSPSNDESWYAFQLLLDFQTHSSVRVDTALAFPLTHYQSTSLEIGLTLALGKPNDSKIDSNENAHIPQEIDNPKYNLYAKVVSVSDSFFILKIDKGSDDSIHNGQTFDIYSGENFIARTRVVSVKMDETALTVIEYKQEKWIDLGFSARRLEE